LKHLIATACPALFAIFVSACSPSAEQEDTLSNEAFLDAFNSAMESSRSRQESPGYRASMAYQNGDYEEAAKWFRLAAEQGGSYAQNFLGVMYRDGEGVPQNDAEAVKWFLLAAKQGHARAQLYLGMMCANGRGLPENDAEAVKWYRQAAEQGDVEAQFLIGGMYVKGEGIPEDYVQAYMWWNLAAARGYPDAPAGKEKLRALMTPAQIAQAQQLSSEWKPVSER
jgi:TPR repeat protein